ncbi:protein kinase [Herbiconiux sp. KACC 21604]|uniref:serine/threonine-protein kinase n=1 Tax=unclassified Herbiconiux TaxID=2618217 RepID=UPI0020A3D201|nr:serine/threonine-protein kinase [Herbiconiux sp. SALV-R1]WPO88408.1 protein kinase [Herbiconiux sp. KACC 21604]
MSIALPESSPTTGELLDGRYLLDSRIGSGGMGVVYRARDETLGRTVAVKVFRESAVEDARTTTEMRFLASLNHAALVTLYDAQMAGDRPHYLVMECVEGPTLRQRLERGALGRKEAATMARDLAEALHVVHQSGIVHRDIKPSNVLLRPSHLPGEEYRAKLADFGIALLVDATRLTAPGTLIGTAAYLSPEQVRGAAATPASDVYSLGLVLLEALTGERAFPQTATHETALARLSRDPVVPGSLGYGWKSLLSAMTAREPSARPSALDVVVAAGELMSGVESDPTATGAIDLDATMVLADPTAHQPIARVEPVAAVPAPEPTAVPSTHVSETAPKGRKRWVTMTLAASALVFLAVVGVSLAALGASSAPSAPAQVEGTEPAQQPDAVVPVDDVQPADTEPVVEDAPADDTPAEVVVPEDTQPVVDAPVDSGDTGPGAGDGGANENKGPGNNNGNGNGGGNGNGNSGPGNNNGNGNGNGKK